MTKTTHLPCPHCNSSDAVTEYETNTYCFSCGTTTPIARHMKDVEYVSKCNKNSVNWRALTKSFPIEALNWLHKYRIDKSLRDKYGLLWDADSRRIIVPSFFAGKLLGYQGRAVYPDQKVKYWQPADKKPLLFLSWQLRLYKEQDAPMVIVEDAISAMVVGEHMPCVALLGSKLDKKGEQLVWLSQLSKDYIIWLDKDKAGREGTRRLEKQLGLIGSVWSTVFTNKDPKEHSNPELKGVLSTWLTYSDI